MIKVYTIVLFPATAIFLLQRRTFDRSETAKNTAIANFRTKNGLAILTLIEKLTGIVRHCFSFLKTAIRTSYFRFKFYFVHLFSPIFQFFPQKKSSFILTAKDAPINIVLVKRKVLLFNYQDSRLVYLHSPLAVRCQNTEPCLFYPKIQSSVCRLLCRILKRLCLYPWRPCI